MKCNVISKKTFSGGSYPLGVYIQLILSLVDRVNIYLREMNYVIGSVVIDSVDSYEQRLKYEFRTTKLSHI